MLNLRIDCQKKRSIKSINKKLFNPNEKQKKSKKSDLNITLRLNRLDIKSFAVLAVNKYCHCSYL